MQGTTRLMKAWVEKERPVFRGVVAGLQKDTDSQGPHTVGSRQPCSIIIQIFISHEAPNFNCGVGQGQNEKKNYVEHRAFRHIDGARIDGFDNI